MKTKIFAAVVVVGALALAGCSGSDSGAASASPTSGTVALKQICPQVDEIMTNNLSGNDISDEQFQAALTDLEAANATATPEAQAVLTPMIEGMKQLVVLASASPSADPANNPVYAAFGKAAQGFVTACAKAGVTLAPSQ